MPRLFPFHIASLAARLKPIGSITHNSGASLSTWPCRSAACTAAVAHLPGMRFSLCTQVRANHRPGTGKLLRPLRLGPCTQERKTDHGQSVPHAMVFAEIPTTFFPSGRYEGVLRELVLKTKRISARTLFTRRSSALLAVPPLARQIGRILSPQSRRCPSPCTGPNG